MFFFMNYINSFFQFQVVECDNMSKTIDILKKEISGQELIERDLHDNLELKKLVREAALLKEKIDVLQKSMGDMDCRRLSKEKAELQKKRDNLVGERSQLSGQMRELRSQISKLETTLNQAEYKNSIKNYREAFYEHVILKKIVSDLDKYCAALERALLQYHSEKMTKINSLIKELWRSIYRGNDIDYVQIQTDHEMGNSTSKRRSYNYRVIQSKNDVDLDMRGRCSAGQRVLACLIIRVALAETFSSNCGVLALDEPTTNLDRVNIVSLCEALNKIVEERESQSNFMLLVITHDEDFITTLAQVQSYYKVDRNNRGKSIISKLRVT